jgi:hypothetical protein
MKSLNIGTTIRKRTKKIKELAIHVCLWVLSPHSLTLYEIANYGSDSVDYYPRSSTKIMHGIYGEKPLVGAEIETGFGENALSLLHELRTERLYCIDPLLFIRMMANSRHKVTQNG